MIPKSGYRFRKRSCSNKELERDVDSTRSYRALCSVPHHLQRLVEHPQHARKLGAALQDDAGGGDDAVGALAAGEFRVFLDAVERHLGGAAVDREHGLVAAEIDRVVAPLAIRHLAPVKVENLAQLGSIER